MARNERKELFRLLTGEKGSMSEAALQTIPYGPPVPCLWLPSKERSMQPVTICTPTTGQTLVGRCEIGASNTESDFWDTHGG